MKTMLPLAVVASIGLLGVVVAAAAETPAPGTLQVHPNQVELKHHRDRQLLQVHASTATGFSLDLRQQGKFTSADPKVASIDASGWITPVGSGVTQISVAVAGQSVVVPVKVSLPGEELPMSFRHEVMPVLSKAGCNMGACHGYSLGKNGFKLSLRGADPDPDYLAITRDSIGRRVNGLAPDASLLISKPLGDSPHEGGARFRRGSLEHEILRRWVEQGCPEDLKDPAQVIRVRVFPDKLVLRPLEKHQVQLLADYSDGSVRDVTRLAIFTANNDRFAEVSDGGVVTAGDLGETAIVARFERVFAASSVLVLHENSKFKPVPLPTHLVDRPVIEKLNRLQIDPSAVAGDEEFLRRVALDLIGLQPKPEEVKAFLADTDPRKREKYIDALFERPEFVDHWSLKWGDLLQNSRTAVGVSGMFLFREFIRGAVASNMPADEFVRKILTARGSTTDDPASAYFAISKDTNDTVERVTQVFCGVRMLCARCHSHPLENWTQADYYGVSSFFSQVSARADTRESPAQPGAKIVQINLASGMSNNPRTNKLQAPKFLGGDEPKLAANLDRRLAYAEMHTAPKNPFFARGLVNRIWSYFFHRGIIDPVDDIRSTNPPINPALLDALTEDFVKNKFDIRRVMRQIVTSQTYQRTSIPTEWNKHDEQNFSHSIPRRIPAEALLDSLTQATGVPESFGGAPAGFRAAQLPDGNVQSAFLSLFGKPQRMDACECERDNSSNMLQALHFINGNSIIARVQNPSGRVAQLLKQKLTDAELVAELYLASVARYPNAKETAVALEFIKDYEAKRRAEAFQDLMWALLNSKDFIMVH